MENRVDEFCLWIIQAIIIPITVGTIEGWSTGYFEELDKYEEECRQIFGDFSNSEESEESEDSHATPLIKQNTNENTNTDFKTKFLNLFTGKNTMYFILATQAIHLIYAVYVGKQFPVQPLSDFENSNIVWETVCLCARDATIAMNSHILILRLSCRVIYDVGTSMYTNFKSTENNENNENKEESEESATDIINNWVDILDVD